MIDNRWHRAALTAVAISALAPLVSLAGDSEQGVGVVAQYRPAAGRFFFSRAAGGESVPVRIGTVVMAGDRVTLPAGAAVVVQLANDAAKSFEGPGTFEIPQAQALGKLAAIFRSIPALFDDEYRLAGTAASRGGEKCSESRPDAAPAIDVPILVPGSRVVAGVRDLPLAWRGGCTPFVVAVASEGGGVLHRESVEGWQVRLDDVSLGVGRYKVTIMDSSGARFEAVLEAVNEGPAVPADIAGDATPLGVVAQAVWIAEQDGGRWRIESFDRLRPLIRAGDRLAGAIGDGVLWGQTTTP